MGRWINESLLYQNEDLDLYPQKSCKNSGSVAHLQCQGFKGEVSGRDRRSSRNKPRVQQRKPERPYKVEGEGGPEPEVVH